LNEAGQVVVLMAIAAVAAVVAIRLGMLVAPRLDRLTEPDDEDDGGDHD
jgi:NADH:ubiquinone oxidoreductase subunit K